MPERAFLIGVQLFKEKGRRREGSRALSDQARSGAGKYDAPPRPSESWFALAFLMQHVPRRPRTMAVYRQYEGAPRVFTYRDVDDVRLLTGGVVMRYAGLQAQGVPTLFDRG